ncbi:MAG: YihY/virulence factor BrkB family protein [Kiritimatiellae bacterium]|nr:YihY/virulence factor BrkB family protein [Kiritimatiellia bacterium]
MIKKVKEACAFCSEGCWQVDLGAYGFLRRAGVHILRFFSTTLKSFSDHRCGLHAAGLTYFTILGFVPVLCMLMVTAKACGVGNFARDKINEQIDAFITRVEEGQKEAEAQAAAVPQEVAVAVTNATAEVTAPALQKSDVDAEKAKEAIYKAKASKDLALQARKFSNEIFDKIDKVDLTTLGWIGFAVLMWTVISTLGHVETAVNEIWLVKKSRPMWRKVYVYLFIVIVLPVFMSLAVSLPILRLAKTALDATLGATSYTKWVGDALVNLIMSRLFGFFVTLAFASLAFAVLLKMMPNCRVGFRSSFRGGFFTALLVGGWMRLCTSAGVGISKSGAMYGSFAVVPIVLAWVFMSWQLILLGSCMSYAFECVHRGSPVLSDG